MVRSFPTALMTPNLFEDIGHPASAEYWTDKVSSISVFRSGDRRAPYKPLLLLWAIGRLAAGNTGPVYFRDAEDDLIRLMDKHRLGNKVRVVFPFVYMGADPDLWRVESEDGSNVARMPQAKKESRPFLRAEVKGGLAPGFAQALGDPQVRSRVVNTLLANEFPESLHEEILEEVGLGHAVVPVRCPRDPRFKKTVMLAYEYRCAFCGFDGYLRNTPVGIDAAHIKMRSYQGPDHITNGMALCVLHHRLFDRGALGLDEDLRILVSMHVIVRDERTRRPLIDLVDTPMRKPQPGYEIPDNDYVNWHYENIFIKPSRQPSAPQARHPSRSTRAARR